MNWAIGIDMYTLMCIKLMTNKDLLYNKKRKKKLDAMEHENVIINTPTSDPLLTRQYYIYNLISHTMSYREKIS